MCDTFVALGNATADGSVLFAKNSDRQSNEPHNMIRIPRTKHPVPSKVRCTYIEIDQVPKTYEVLLLKPSWIWGCEMGANEFGLNIGNEAVFTKESYGEDSLIGMDMVRLALERCKTSDEALDFIIGLLETYGQGGNCGYEKDFTYHNAFLIADTKSAWVLETAGGFWVAEKVKDVRSISNCLTIGKDFDRSHPDVVKHAIDRGWCKDEKDFDFAKCYSHPLITRFSGGRERHATSMTILERHKGHITAHTMRSILRTHSPSIEHNPFSKGSLKSICMHAGCPFGNHTTGSYVAKLNSYLCTYWITGSSTPCISLFKPFWFISDERLTFADKEKELATEYWKIREQFHRKILNNQIKELPAYLKERDLIELNLQKKMVALDVNSYDPNKLLSIMEYAIEQEEKLIQKTIDQNKNHMPKLKGNPYFRYYWKRQNRKLSQ